MKKRFLSILLCMALIIGVLPMSALTAFADKPEVQEMTDIVTRVTASGDVWVTFGGVPTATEYTIYCGEGWARTIYVTDESKNEGTFTEFFARAEFYELGSGESRCQSYRARVYAENFYGEKIAEGYSDNFKGPYDKFIGIPRRVYLSSTGILIFEPVEEAATYSVSCYYNGKYLKGNNRVVQNWFDIGDIAREGDYYKFYITAWPKNTNKHLPSRMETSIKYTAEKELAGEVYVNDDRSLTYDWYLGYLDKHTDTALNVQWQKSLNEGEGVEWVDISESEKNSVPVYDLRVKVTAANHNGEVLSSHNSYTDPDHPYFATDYAGLRAVFNQHRDKGKTAYIVLMNDIEGSKTALATNEGNVDLDLNGYTLSYKGTSYSFIRTGNDSYKDLDSNVTIRDTKGTGRIEYQCTQMQYHYSRSTSWHYSDDYLEYAGCNTTVLTGNITVYGGTIVNNSHILFYSYPARESDNLREKVYAPRLGYNYGDGLKMYGGTFEAYKPVIIEASQTDKEFGLYGGTLRATGPVAVEIQFGKNADADYMYFPQIRNCEIINASGNSQAVAMVAGYNYTYDDITGAIAYKDFGKLFMPETKAYIDGVEQSAVTNGTVYDGKHDIQGPIYSQKYELKTEIQLSKLEFNITEPAVGEFPDYTVTGGDDRLYDVDLYWYQETTPDNFAEMDSGHMFHSGIWYEAMMILRPKDGVDLSIIGNVTVGNKQANRYGNMFILYYYINDDFFDIYVGSTRVGRKSKGDVLGDGGSVQIYEPGEYQLSEDDINYGLKASEFAGRPVLVLNNFTLDHDEYRSDTPNPAQIYLGENVNVLIQGENSLYHMSDADGIIVGSERNVRFFGDGSLTADLDQCDQNALSGWGAKVCFNEAVKVTLRGTYGINLTSGMDPGEDTLVSVENDVILTCGSYVTGITAEHPEPRYGKGLYCDCLYLQDGGAIVCDSDLYCDAMYTGGTTFRNDGYDIRVLKLGEYGKPPYEPGEGVNVGGEDEGNYHYISIYPRQTNINFFKVKIPEARAGKSITYEASVLAGRGYKVEEYDSTTWKDGVLWKKGGTELNPDEDNVFIAGETYTVEVSIVPTDARYAFADFGSGVAASVNGKFVGVNTYYYNDSNYSVKYTFTVGEAEISNINLTVDEPVTGDYLPYYAAVPENADYAIYEDYALGTSNFSGGVAWCEDSYDIAVGDNMFAAGKIYDVFIAVKSKDPEGCPFVAKDDITVTVNDMPAEISLYGDGWCVVHYTFQAKGKNVIDSVAVNIDVPVVGEKPSYVATVSPMVGYMVEPFDNSYYKVGVAWSIGEDFIAPDSNYTFKPGKIYTANIMLCIIDADNNEFADKTLLPATVNGKYTAATKQGSNSYLVKYDFIMPEGDHIPGDINGDGEVDNKDLTRLFQYLSNWDVAVVEPALDVNGDNSVDNKDLTRLFQYLSNWDVEIF